LIVAGIVVLMFGGAKLPQLAKGLGEGIREFKKSVGGEDDTAPPPGPAPASTASATPADAEDAAGKTTVAAK
jgi:sec-independent protein translocase protein TatA